MSRLTAVRKTLCTLPRRGSYGRTPRPRVTAWTRRGGTPSSQVPGSSGDGLEEPLGVGHPAEDGALSLDHLKPHALELREVRRDAVRQDDRLVATVIGFAHGGVHADLEGHAADDQRLDAM